MLFKQLKNQAFDKHVENMNVTNFHSIANYWAVLYSKSSVLYIIHDRPSYLCCPDVLSLLGDPLSGNGCGSPNHIQF